MASSSSSRKASSKTALVSPSPSPAAPEVPKVKAKKKVLGAITQVYRRFSKDTSGTFRFEAVDPKSGTPLAQDDKGAHVTQLYVRKSSSAVSSDPKFLIVTIQEVNKLPKGATVSTEEDD